MFSQGRIDCQHAIGMSENANGAVLCGKYLEFYKQEKLKLLPEFLKKKRWASSRFKNLQVEMLQS